MLCECGLSLCLSKYHNVLTLLLRVMVWDDTMPVWWNEVRWSFPFNIFGPRLSMGNWTLRHWDLMCGEGLLYTLLSAHHWPSPGSGLGSSPSPPLPCTDSPSPSLLKRQCWVFHFLLKHIQITYRESKILIL